MNPAAIGVDIGGGKIVTGRVEPDGTVAEQSRLVTPRADSDALVNAVVRMVSALGPGLPVGVGVAALVTDDGELRYGPNLGVERVHLRQLLEARLSVPVSVHNDATAALWGEARAGAATGIDCVLLLTLGTGVGGAVLDHGRFVLGAGFGGELGHIVVAEGGRSCRCGSVGCLEAYASGTAIGVRAYELAATKPLPPVLKDVPGGFDEIDVSRAAADGDPFSVEVVREAGRWLGVGLTSLVNAFDPELVVVGGGVTDAVGHIMIPEATEVMTSRLIGAALRRPPRVVRAALGDDAGMIGAALLAPDREASIDDTVGPRRVRTHARLDPEESEGAP
ncbi:MAG: ROK family protein [Acidimicrobiia bacterium]|nr:ROK family protein [Acidimicrobiia bacterium]